MFKNVPNQFIYLDAFDSSTGLPASGDVLNITPYVRIDSGSLTVLSNPTGTAVSTGNAPGSFVFSLTQAETNGDILFFSGKSVTPNVVVLREVVATYPSGWLSTARLPEITGSGNIPPNPTMAEAQMLWYMFLRNNTHVTSSLRSIYNTVGIPVLSGVMNDDGSTFYQGKLN